MNRRQMVAVGLVILVALSAVGAALARGAAGFDVGWSVMGAGGRDMASETYAVRGTAGQLAVGSSAGSEHALHSGYWTRMASMPAYSRVYLPLVTRH